MRGQRRQTETTVINKFVVKDANGKWCLALDSPELRETKEKFERNFNKQFAVEMPMLRADTAFGGKLQEALATGQAWVHPEKPNVVQWYEGKAGKAVGNDTKTGLAQQSDLSRTPVHIFL